MRESNETEDWKCLLRNWSAQWNDVNGEMEGHSMQTKDKKEKKKKKKCKTRSVHV